MMAMYFLLALVFGLTIEAILQILLKEKKPFAIAWSILSMMALIKTFQDPLVILKGFLFAQILIFIGYYDLKTRTIPNIVHILILILSLIAIKPMGAIVGFFFIPLPYFIVAYATGGIGGGDIKLMASCGAFLGLIDGILALVITSILILICNIKRTKGESFPMGPYIGLGCFLSYLI